VPQPLPDQVITGVKPPANYGATPISTRVTSVQLSRQNSIGDVPFQ